MMNRLRLFDVQNLHNNNFNLSSQRVMFQVNLVLSNKHLTKILTAKTDMTTKEIKI